MTTETRKILTDTRAKLKAQKQTDITVALIILIDYIFSNVDAVTNLQEAIDDKPIVKES